MALQPLTVRAERSQQNALDYEIAQEQAGALGRLGRALETALAVLASRGQRDRPDRVEALTATAIAARAELVQQASEALWRFVIQREACGLRDERQVMREYRVPAEVRNRMGTFGISHPGSS